jgi:hypothetical protein
MSALSQAMKLVRGGLTLSSLLMTAWLTASNLCVASEAVAANAAAPCARAHTHTNTNSITHNNLLYYGTHTHAPSHKASTLACATKRCMAFSTHTHIFAHTHAHTRTHNNPTCLHTQTLHGLLWQEHLVADLDRALLWPKGIDA